MPTQSTVMERRARPQQTDRGPDGGGTWTRRRLIAAGFEPRVASDLADDTRIDLHELLGLVDRGCRPALAARILWPLDEERRRS